MAIKLKESDLINILKGLLGKSSVIRFTPGKYTPRGISDTHITINDLEYWVEIKTDASGTPMTNDEADLWSQITILDRGERFGTSFFKFRQAYFKETYWSWMFDPAARDAFQAKLDSVAFRVRKEDCLDLPERVYMTQEVELTGATARHYKTMRDEALVILQNDQIIARHKIVEILRLHQITGGTIAGQIIGSDKIDALVDIIQSAGEPVVIVAVYRQEIQAIEDAVKSIGKSVGHISGGVNDETRQHHIDAFSRGLMDVIILQIDAAGLGIDGLQKASSTMIFYSSNYRWDSRQQAEGRLHRSGQTKPVTIIDLVATVDGKPTIDSVINETLQTKDTKITSLIDAVKHGLI